MDEHPFERQATADDLYRLAEAEVIGPDALELALKEAGITPDRRSWKIFFDRLFLFLGSALVLAGVIYFFAYNWDKLGRFAKFGLIEAAILAAVVIAFYRGLGTITGKVALLAAAILVGPLLAVYGQVYQTGADAHGLFLLWFILIAGWVVAGFFAPLWMVFIALVNVWAVLYWNQIIAGRFETETSTLFLVMVLVNTVIFLAWEEIARRGVSWMRPRWYPAIIGITVVSYLSFFSVAAIVDKNDATLWLYLPLAGLLFLYFRRRSRDLLLLAALFLSGIISVTTFIIRLVEFDSADVFLFIGLLVVGMTGGAAALLRKIQRSWEKAA